MEIEQLEKADRILFNERKKTLKVKEKEDGEVTVRGPGGAEYILYTDDGTQLVARKGKKKYSSYLENLRKVGEWIRNENEWIHSGTEAEVRLEKEGKLWQVEIEGMNISFEMPKYGFTSEENAKEKAEQIMEKYPEGKGDEES